MLRFLCIWLCLPLVMPPGMAQEAAVEGDYLEDRSNHVYGCYCEWSGESVTGGTEATLGWRFTMGSFEGVNLAGTRLALVIRSQATLSQGQPPRRSVLVLDKGATAAQQEASARWLKRHFPELLGEIVERRTERIEFTRESNRASLRVPGLIRMEVRKANPSQDSLPGSITWYDPFIPLTEATLSTTLQTSYEGSELEQRWNRQEPGVRGYFGSFRIPANGPAPDRPS